MPRRSALLKKDVGKNEQTITDKIQASSPIHGISSAGSHKSSRPIPAKKITCSSGNSTLKRGSQRKQEKNTSISLDRKSLQDQLKKNKKLECPKCSILFKTVSGYIYHQQRCGQEKPIITCTLCDKTYTSEAGLQYHLKVSHGTDKSSTGLEDLEAESSAVVIGNKKRKSAVRAAELIISTANADDDEVEIESTQLGGNNKDVALNKNTIKTARVALKKNGAIKCLNKVSNPRSL
ncbi:uncharacterized protein TRIADDRAFT_58398 [Trichoplax adhaerens]|uniref:C2H2-type domain-containing protein n=1 Tax=Trichoplax adhaerens TaxID=10228 RepID=B3S200_TRIAD|nr:predicted protein [Trichoplax adhaerens]EDV23596.1 predicted protein [Trichoplax adhaerens]|eukprot:XP_002114506.1 predicted protein [Trichoplax adhaerens]